MKFKFLLFVSIVLFFSCDSEPKEVHGCTDSQSCNYDPESTLDNNSCLDWDECGECGGDNSTCLDECGVPNGDNSTCMGCDGIPNSGLVLDECDVCDGDGLDECGGCGEEVELWGECYNIEGITELYLYGNQLTILPESIGDLISLEELYLNHNQLTTLPESIGNLSSLEILYLNDNQLTTLPESIGNLSSLTELDLSYNQLTSIPESIGYLSSLEGLYLLNNQLTSLPTSICNLPESCYINVEGNCISQEYLYDCIDHWYQQDCGD